MYINELCLFNPEMKDNEKQLKKEIESWRETCEILCDKSLMKDIHKSLKEISEGKGIPASDL